MHLQFPSTLPSRPSPALHVLIMHVIGPSEHCIKYNLFTKAGPFIRNVHYMTLRQPGVSAELVQTCQLMQMWSQDHSLKTHNAAPGKPIRTHDVTS